MTNMKIFFPDFAKHNLVDVEPDPVCWRFTYVSCLPPISLFEWVTPQLRVANDVPSSVSKKPKSKRLFGTEAIKPACRWSSAETRMLMLQTLKKKSPAMQTCPSQEENSKRSCWRRSGRARSEALLGCCRPDNKASVIALRQTWL